MKYTITEIANSDVGPTSTPPLGRRPYLGSSSASYEHID